MRIVTRIRPIDLLSMTYIIVLVSRCVYVLLIMYNVRKSEIEVENQMNMVMYQSILKHILT